MTAFTTLFFLTMLSCGQTNSSRPVIDSNTEQTNDSCDNPDAPVSCSFLNMPAALSRTIKIAAKDEPDEKLVIAGTVYKADGKTPFPNVVIYAYHTDSKGLYSKKGTETGVQKWHGKLHGWCKTDSKGQYRIETIKPASYPGSTIPAHIHAAIRKPGGTMYWISDFVFKNDKFITQKYLANTAHMVGGTGIVELQKDPENNWTGTRNIILTK